VPHLTGLEHYLARAGDQAFRMHMQATLLSESRAVQGQLEHADDVVHADGRDAN
jgi:hypothetical protein